MMRPGFRSILAFKWVVFACRRSFDFRRPHDGDAPESDPLRAVADRGLFLARGDLHYAQRPVYRRRAGHRLRGRHHDADRLRDHADPAGGGLRLQNKASRAEDPGRLSLPYPFRRDRALPSLRCGRRRPRRPRRARWARWPHIGTALYGKYLFPFEIASVLLLVGVVGAGIWRAVGLG